MAKELRIWHVGNWCIHLGQKYVDSPFEAPSKDVEVVNDQGVEESFEPRAKPKPIQPKGR